MDYFDILLRKHLGLLIKLPSLCVTSATQTTGKMECGLIGQEIGTQMGIINQIFGTICKTNVSEIDAKF